MLQPLLQRDLMQLGGVKEIFNQLSRMLQLLKVRLPFTYQHSSLVLPNSFISRDIIAGKNHIEAVSGNGNPGNLQTEVHLKSPDVTVNASPEEFPGFSQPDDIVRSG